MVGELERQIQTLRSSFEAAQSDIQAKQAAIEQLEQTKGASEAELAQVKTSLQKLQAEDGSVSLAGQQQVMFATLESRPCIYHCYSL